MGTARSRGPAWIPAAAALALLSGTGAADASATGPSATEPSAAGRAAETVADTATATAEKRGGGRDVPALSIEVTDGLDGMEPGDETEYTVTLRNDGDEAVEGIVLSQGVPPEMELVDTDGDRVGDPGEALEGLAVWELDLKPGETAKGRTKARLKDPGERVWRVAATACAQTHEDSPPVVCATDANLLPKAPEAEPAEAAAASAEPSGGVHTGAVLAGLVVGVGLVYFLWRRRAAQR